MTVDPSAPTAAETGRPARGLNAGATLGKYRLDRVLGSGGMGVVWAAFDPDLERAVALKLLHSGDGEPALRTRLLREARAMARLKHPNILTVYDVGTDAGRDYIAMELVDGSSLDAWLAERPPRPEIYAALLAAGRGLAAAHAAGLVHRDFKPHNVMRSRDGHIYVTDFGLARGQIEDDGELAQLPAAAHPIALASGSHPRRGHDSLLDSPLTQTGVLIGTPAYMAPEQFARRAPGPRSDQFAFCVTAWEALVGTRPFRGADLRELESAVNVGVRSAITVDLPPIVRAILARGLEPDPELRWPDLPTLLSELGTAIAAPVPPPRSRRRWIAAGAGTALVGGIAIVALGVGSSRNAVPDDCTAPEAAFDRVWGPARQAEVERANPDGVDIGASSVLDEGRRRWIREFRATCSAPQTPARTETLDCLRAARDKFATLTAPLSRPGAHASVGRIAMAFSAIEVCVRRNDE